jgi:plasmid stabilization system protein ParE
MIYRLSRRPRRDVLLIWRYIAQDNEPAADRFIDRLMRAFQLLGDNPHAGRRRDELRSWASCTSCMAGGIWEAMGFDLQDWRLCSLTV